jgi:hypothetical protein
LAKQIVAKLNLVDQTHVKKRVIAHFGLKQTAAAFGAFRSRVVGFCALTWHSPGITLKVVVGSQRRNRLRDGNGKRPEEHIGFDAYRICN